MRYLRRYNEELEPETYRKKANELIYKGDYHVKRGEEMADYASLVAWRRLRDKCQRAGEIEVRLETSLNSYYSSTTGNKDAAPDYVGKFYLAVDIGLQAFAETVGYEIAQGNEDFTVNLDWYIDVVPTTEECYDRAHAAAKERFEYRRTLDQKIRKYDKNYGFPMAFFYFPINFVSGSHYFGEPDFYQRDDRQVAARPADRAASGKIRSEILWQLDERNDEPYTVELDGVKHEFSNRLEAFEGILQHYGLSSDHGLEVRRKTEESKDKIPVYDYVKQLPGNFFYFKK